MTQTTGTNYDLARSSNTLKHVYHPKIQQMIPDEDKIARELEFVEPDQQIGLMYNMPVTVSREMGATFNNDGSAFRLNKPLARKVLNSQIQGTEFVLRSLMSYGAINRALKQDVTTRAGMKAFVNATKDTMKELVKSASFFREATLLYGGGPGVASALGTVTATTGSASTTLIAILAVGDWATMLWVGSEDGEYDIYSSGGVKRNTNGTDVDTIYKLNAADASTFTLTFTSHATNVTNVVATDQIFFAGARTKENLGLIGACQTASGNLWNIPVLSYPALWKPKTTNVGGALTFEGVMRGVSKVADIGFKGTLRVHMCPFTWQDIADDQAALVRHADKAGGSVELGYEDITFYGQTGKVKLVPNFYIKRGIALGLPEGKMKRVGSTDITFSMGGVGQMVREPDDYAGVEARCYWDQAAFSETPGYMHLWTGITNSAN